MSQNVSSSDNLYQQILLLPRAEILKLVERVIGTIGSEIGQQAQAEEKPPRHSAYGVLAHLGTGPSAEDIDEVRGEMWANFPREDI